ncbi:hypothetical protein SPHINGOT1_260146 [Sphingomonas sp. T1]|nr:hypothetical protein SPHINGOT1_260146 [Sphingomonas sp. T1]
MRRTRRRSRPEPNKKGGGCESAGPLFICLTWRLPVARFRPARFSGPPSPSFALSVVEGYVTWGNVLRLRSGRTGQGATERPSGSHNAPRH